MRRTLTTVAVLLLSAAAVPATAEDGVYEGFELVRTFEAPQATHLEFVQRDGRVFALLGQRDEVEADAGGSHIFDVTDPDPANWFKIKPTTTRRYEPTIYCPQGANDQAASPDGRWLVLTADANNNGSATSASGCVGVNLFVPGYQRNVKDIAIVDWSDIDRPFLKGTPNGFPPLKGVHTAQFHPSRNIAYLSTQETPDLTRDVAGGQVGPQLSILDLEGESPTVTTVAMPHVGSSPHDITFNPDGTRAYVAAVTASYILDTSDPLAPQLVSVIVNPAINIHHEAMVTPNGRYLLITDEVTGATFEPVCPGGGVHVYDLSVEQAPVPVGVFIADDVRNVVSDPAQITGSGRLPICTAHEGNFSADGRSFVLGWYWSGARRFDVSVLADGTLPPGAPVGPIAETGFARPGVLRMWSAKFHPTQPDVVLASNQATGLEVYRVSG